MNKLYMWVGTFAVVMMVYLFVAPKLVKKGSGEPPRAGSNAEQMAIAQTEAQMLGPAPTATPSLQYALPSGSGQSFRVFPEGARGPAQSGISFGGFGNKFNIGQAYRARRRGRRAFRGFKPRNPKMNLFPFANVALA